MDADFLPIRDLRVLERLRGMTEPFTTATALQMGASYGQLRRWVQAQLLCHPIKGVYRSPLLEDSLALRVEVLHLVVPAHCVVTDRTAAWLWGANMVLAPGDHLVTPAVSVFGAPGNRLRNDLTDSGERMLEPDRDVADLEGLRVTTPLRTACDLGRLLHRQQALSAMDSLLALHRFTPAELRSETRRFAGYRGVIQLRALSVLADGASGSPGESALRLHWYDAGLPRPRCQVPVPNDKCGTWWLDIGLEEQRFAAEYDGEAFHGPDRREHDEHRRAWLREREGWVIVVMRAPNVYGRTQDADRLLRAAYDTLK